MEDSKLGDDTNIENMVNEELDNLSQNIIHEMRGPAFSALDITLSPENKLFEDVAMGIEFPGDVENNWSNEDKLVFNGFDPKGNQTTEKGYQLQRPTCQVTYSQRDDVAPVPQLSLLQESSPINFDNFEVSLKQDFGNGVSSYQSQTLYSYQNHQSQCMASKTNNLHFDNTARENSLPLPITQRVKAKKRRRKTTPAQRKAANIRERRRMFSLNDAFDQLRKKVPTFDHETKLSRIETLRLAIQYIGFMTDELQGQ